MVIWKYKKMPKIEIPISENDIKRCCSIVLAIDQLSIFYWDWS